VHRTVWGRGIGKTVAVGGAASKAENLAG
jgi:hypothetical protein